MGHRALSLSVDLASQRDDSVFDRVLYAFVELVLYKCRVSRSKREASGERTAGEEPEGHVVKVTLSSVHLLNVSLHNGVASQLV